MSSCFLRFAIPILCPPQCMAAGIWLVLQVRSDSSLPFPRFQHYICNLNLTLERHLAISFAVEGAPSTFVLVSTLDRKGNRRESKRSHTVRKDSNPHWDMQLVLYVWSAPRQLFRSKIKSSSFSALLELLTRESVCSFGAYQ